MIKGVSLIPNSVEKRLDAIFSNALNETNSNHTMVGSERGSVSVSRIAIRWVPQNKRFYFAFDKSTFTSNKPSNHTLEKAGGVGVALDRSYIVKPINWGKEFYIKDFMGCDIKVKKTKVEVLPCELLNKEYSFVCVAHDAAAEFMQAELESMRLHCLRALGVLVTLHGGSVGDLIKVTDGDDAIYGDEFLDSVPSDVRFNTKVVKKQYAHKTEFKGSVYAATYISNRALESIAPVISENLQSLHSLLAEKFSSSVFDSTPVGVVDSLGGKSTYTVDDLFSGGLCDWFNALHVKEQNIILGLGGLQ